jgi:hypothetical protein
VARLNMDGIPRRDLKSPSPCWTRGHNAVGQCNAGLALAASQKQ